MSELRTRVQTGVLGGAVLIAVLIFGGRFGVGLVIALMTVAMNHEFSSMVFSLSDKDEKRKAMMGLAWIITFIVFWMPSLAFEMMIFSFVSLFIYYLVIAERHAENPSDFRSHFRELMAAIFGLVYLTFLPLFLIFIQDTSNGTHWVLLSFLTVFANDTGAYFAGRKYGKTKLYPLISPKKTREGSLGGLLTGFVVLLIYKLLIFKTMSWFAVLGMPWIVGMASQTGDLCESFLKRAFDTKDSGSILPGHGGFLDRFDGVVFSLPFMYVCVKILG